MTLVVNRILKKFVFLLLILSFYSCSNNDNYSFLMGNTMGTSYSIKFSKSDIPIYKVQKDINDIFDIINSQMSTYKSNSEISAFNNMPSNVSKKISPDFYYVLGKSEFYYQLSEGLFDITIEPLSKVWGFKNENFILPNTKDIDSVLNITGFDKVKLLGNNTIIKGSDNVKISLNAIAKGYAVDKISDYFEDNNFENYMIEIGGEIRTKGKNASGGKWKIGLSSFDLEFGDIIEYITVNDASLATSGDYRNFITYNDISYSHVINPKTGYPTTNNVVSATIIATDCIDADALATVANVASADKTIDLIDKLDRVECLIIERGKDGMKYYYSKNMKDYIN